MMIDDDDRDAAAADDDEGNRWKYLSYIQGCIKHLNQVFNELKLTTHEKI